MPAPPAQPATPEPTTRITPQTGYLTYSGSGRLLRISDPGPEGKSTDTYRDTSVSKPTLMYSTADYEDPGTFTIINTSDRAEMWIEIGGQQPIIELKPGQAITIMLRYGPLWMKWGGWIPTKFVQEGEPKPGFFPLPSRIMKIETNPAGRGRIMYISESGARVEQTRAPR